MGMKRFAVIVPLLVAGCATTALLLESLSPTASAQQLPTDVDLKSAYCMDILRSEINQDTMAENAIHQALDYWQKHSNTKSPPAGISRADLLAGERQMSQDIADRKSALESVMKLIRSKRVDEA
jgi:hypothetical protein